MIGKEFVIDKKTFLKRKLTILQHKLRVVMKCYTISNFKLDDSENTFTFQKSYRINGIRMDDKNVNSGSYSVDDMPNTNKIILKISVN